MGPRVVLLAAVLSCCSGDLVHGPPETVLALAGGDVTLPCNFSIPASEDFPTVEWSKEGLQPNVVFLYRDGCETPEMKNPAFRYRTSLITKELKNGNVSLRISNVQLTDAGKYQCMRLWKEDPWDITVVELVVGAVSEPKLSVTAAEGGGVTFQCAADCWLPEPEIYFLDEHGNKIAADEPKRDRDARGCFSVTRKATLQDATNRVSCRVHQPEINQTRDVEMMLPGVGRCWCSLLDFIAVVSVLLLCNASCALAVFLWKKCRKSAESPNSPTSSYQSTRSCSCEDKSLLQSVHVIGTENRRNTTTEMLTMKVRDLELKLKEKEDAILQLRSNNGAQLIDVVCLNDVFLDSPAASTNSSPPTSGNLPQNKRKRPGILRQISHPAPSCSIKKLCRRHSSPAHLNFSGSSPSEKRPGRINRSMSDPRAFGLCPNRHSSVFPSPARSNGPFTYLANVTEESEMLIAQ
ncbi:butyrophilin subfamily 1 member A1-like [Anarrhichthys ocellatus]|uniref:butyrophilin subfamily 1 member A1-like n=1 Tax=Anarrhichthys ocellatus TaxID=433405 RepID=UPI0012EDFFC0|nr:butyrophilin subfamily 1 member A1-like [Anarrhichthys ocellatus]